MAYKIWRVHYSLVWLFLQADYRFILRMYVRSSKFHSGASSSSFNETGFFGLTPFMVGRWRWDIVHDRIDRTLSLHKCVQEVKNGLKLGRHK